MTVLNENLKHAGLPLKTRLSLNVEMKKKNRNAID